MPRASLPTLSGPGLGCGGRDSAAQLRQKGIHTPHCDVLVGVACGVACTVPDTRIGCCLEPDGNGVSSKGGGLREGRAPQHKEGISSQLPAGKETTWNRRKKERRARRDEEEPACTE
jgi:hypothetical protein